MKTRRFDVLLIVGILSITATFAQAGSKVAVIFNGGDDKTSGSLADKFKRIEIDAIKLYKEAGYKKIIILSPGAPTSLRPTTSNLRKVLRNISNADDIQIQIISHGAISSENANQEKQTLNLIPTSSQAYNGAKAFIDRFPVIDLSESEKRLLTKANDSPSGVSSVRFYFASTEGSVSLDDLKKDLISVREKNPKTPITIITGACYSGAVARSLADFPGVQSFTASRPVLPGLFTLFESQDDFGFSKFSSYDYDLQKNLKQGMTFQEAHDSALSTYLSHLNEWSKANFSLSDNKGITTPRSGSQEFVTNWCIKNSVKTNAKPAFSECRDDKLLGPVEKTNAIVFKYFSDSSEYKRCVQNTLILNQIKKLKKSLLIKAFNAARNILKKESSPDTKELSNRLEESFQNCIWKKPMHYSFGCSEYSLTKNVFAPAYNLVPKDEPTELQEKVTKMSDQCGDDIVKEGVPTTSEGEAKASLAAMKALRCYINKSVSDPLIAYSASASVRFGNACTEFEVAAQQSADDNTCLEKFKLGADCVAWKRLSEFNKMGRKRLINDSKSQAKTTPDSDTSSHSAQ